MADGHMKCYFHQPGHAPFRSGCRAGNHNNLSASFIIKYQLASQLDFGKCFEGFVCLLSH